MDSVKYIGMDVHKEAISVAVLNSSGKLMMECVIETKAITILDFLKGLRGSLHVTFEEGTWAAWLYDLIKPHVTELVACNPRRNALLKEGSKSDRIDARKLAELLRSNLLRSVYHGEQGVRKLKELARSYLAISKDLGRVMSRVKATYRSWGDSLWGQAGLCAALSLGVAGQDPGSWCATPSGVLLPTVGRQQVRQELLAEAKKHSAWKLLRGIPFIGPIRAADGVTGLCSLRAFAGIPRWRAFRASNASIVVGCGMCDQAVVQHRNAGANRQPRGQHQ
jgi:hypothetical protein